MKNEKNTIIISELTREECLMLPKQIKKDITESYGDGSISNWSELIGLSRLVIVLNHNSKDIIMMIKNKYPGLNVHLSEPILRRHKSIDELETPILSKINLYDEPKPQPILNNEEKSKILLEPLSKSPRIILESD